MATGLPADEGVAEAAGPGAVSHPASTAIPATKVRAFKGRITVSYPRRRWKLACARNGADL
ncbi:hypothetical protein GCM10018962_43050 [Dactylosporangium matsuzakiense]|uniref:Uncharacterized protein n=1 Tax=Dactylosporangium matsuzakiense TaxID=53360 RepID=A0A9W6NKJ7_9ACTN|nr:hypothetical protein GCM10017581_016170 [Dactylosporangium matsuzakiense]